MSSPGRASGRDGDDVSDTGSDTSYVESEPSQQLRTDVCQWRTTEFHDQECSRYFDCPSHQVGRRLSTDDGHNENNDADEAISRGISELNISSEQSQGRSSSPGTAHGADLDEPLHSPRSIPAASGPSTQQSESRAEPSPSELEARPLPRLPDEEDQHEAPSVDTDRRLDPSADLVESPSWDEEGEPRHAASAPPDHTRNEALGLGLQGQGREGSYPPSPRIQTGPQSPVNYSTESRRASEFVLPRWQPDAEVTYCPICHSQFNIFVRKHHCRKCGRVVCNACSPHRIIIPHQYIVRPPGSEIPLPQSLLMDGLGGGYFDVNGLSGGERVRLCNPCVPDPNTAPPQSPLPSQAPSPRPSHHRSRSSISNALGPAPNRYSAVVAPSSAYDQYRYPSSRTRSITMAGGPSSRQARNEVYPATLERIIMGASSASASASTSYPTRTSSLGNDASSSRQRRLPPTPQIAEEDECPICHRELPSRNLPDFEAAREAHINMCIQTHSTYGSPRRGETAEGLPLPPPRKTGMYAYSATEKDCIDDAECTICLEEFTPKVRMARLECLCRFHYACISAWFVNHPGRCPVHQHDGFGY